MTKRLIINDANVLIDIEKAELVDLIFELDYEFAVPDVLYEEEISPFTSEFKGSPLISMEFDDEVSELLFEKQEQYKETAMSRNDISALVLAIQHECMLLTGEKILRSTAKAEGLEVHGTLWLVEELFNNNLMPVEDVEKAYEKLKKAGSHLPWDEIKKQLKRFGENK